MNSAAEIWKKVLQLMEGEDKLSSTTINTWFDDAEALALEGDRLVLSVPSNFKRDIILSRYLPNVKAALRELFSADLDVLILGEGEKEKFGKQEETPFLPGGEEYTFDKFVVGSSNKFAYAAAQAVSEAPGHAMGYNPLFLYGGSGLGKTHLLYAIAHAIHDKHPEYNIVYIRGDTFTNELVDAIQRKKNQEFREKYRSADVFLMDDVQFIAGRDFTQEEMFHTFNTLYEQHKQIVFTADRPPQEMLRLDDRLKTRFSWGLPVDIVPPDYETRVAIVKNKAIRRGTDLPESVLQYIAENITENVRQLEGTVNRIVALQELMGEHVDVDTVIKATKEFLKNKAEFLPTPEVIIEEVSRFYNFTPEVILSKARTKDVVLARQVAMFITREMTTLSLEEIGEAFNRDHSTVMNGLDRIRDMQKKSPEIAEIIKDIKANINARYE